MKPDANPRKTIHFVPVPGNREGYSSRRKQVGNKIFELYAEYPETKERWHEMCNCEVCLNRLWDDDIFRRSTKDGKFYGRR